MKGNEMKKLIIILLMLVMTVAVQAQDVNEPQEYVTLRVMTEPEFTDGVANIEGWIGYGQDESEAGVILGYETMQDNGDESKFSIGLFAMYHLPDVRPIIENILWPSEFLPPEISAEPSIGISGQYSLDGDGLKLSSLLEMRVYDNMSIMTKYNVFAESEVADEWQVGLSYLWEW